MADEKNIVRHGLSGCEVAQMFRIGKGVFAKRQGFAVVPVLRKYQQSSKFGGYLPHETRVLCESFDVSFVSCVEENRSLVFPVGFVI